jgi:hypothetical protein
MHAKLRCKLKSLAAEARIIRFEEQRARKGWRRLALKQIAPDTQIALHGEYDGLHRHRTHDLRIETRAALLAYAYLRGRDYRAVENATNGRRPPVARIANIVNRFGGVIPETTMDTIRDWLGFTDVKDMSKDEAAA